MLGLLLLPAACGYNENPNTGEKAGSAINTFPVEQIYLSGPDHLSRITIPTVE